VKNTGVRFALSINALAAIVLGLLPGPLLDLCARLLSQS
jgi:NADH:ubiquinone oxidoreductase subunit 2 (subunit N)